mmetsp:Transcript_40329/g.72669  ORF Transcript_40329/g.72669 Transcript_40329/m.72669 type:complete len:207 (-) Transcript_40329:1589-2209(-)
MEKLSNLIVEDFFKLQPCPNDTILKAHGSLIHQRLPNGHDGLKPGILLHGLRIVRIAQIRIDILTTLLELSLKIIPRPLQRMLNLIGKILQSTHRDALFWRIARGTIVLGNVRNDHLGIALRSQRSALKHGKVIKQYALINVQPGLDVVECGTDAVQFVVEVVPKNILRVGPHLLLVVDDVYVRIHFVCRPCPRGRFELVDILVSK